MDRRTFLSLFPAGVASQPLLAAAPAHLQRESHPNFLFLIADDLTFRSIHALNNPEVQTPNLDRLAASGCAFTHCFHQGSWEGAVCTPSRTMLNTGLTTFRAQQDAEDAITWGQTLGEAGYDTYVCGKWHLSPMMLGRSFHEMGAIGPGMFDSTAVDGAAYNRPAPGNHWQPDDLSQRGHWVSASLWHNERPDSIQHSCSIFAETASGFLRDQLAHREKPFFMYVGFNSPHDPRQSPREYLDLYPEQGISTPPNFLPEHPFDQGDARERDEVLAPFPRTEEAVRLHRREYYALITYLDAQIGKILDALDASGRAGNTYVIFSADHGLAVGEHGLMGKQNLYDCSVRMPLLISGPGLQRGRVVDELVYQHSLYATTCELANVPLPPHVEFPSIAPLLHEQRTMHGAVFCRYKTMQRSIRTVRYKLIVYPQARQVQLFDLEQDPWEMHNLSAQPGYAAVERELWQSLRAMQKELDDPLKLEEI